MGDTTWLELFKTAGVLVAVFVIIAPVAFLKKHVMAKTVGIVRHSHKAGWYHPSQDTLAPDGTPAQMLWFPARIRLFRTLVLCIVMMILFFRWNDVETVYQPAVVLGVLTCLALIGLTQIKSRTRIFVTSSHIIETIPFRHQRRLPLAHLLDITSNGDQYTSGVVLDFEGGERLTVPGTMHGLADLTMALKPFHAGANKVIEAWYEGTPKGSSHARTPRS